MATKVTEIGNIVLYQAQCTHYFISGLDLNAISNEVLQSLSDGKNIFSNDRNKTGLEFEDLFFEHGEETKKLVDAVSAIASSIGMEFMGSAWAQVHHKYESCNLHDHSAKNVGMSFVFYVKVPDKAGKLYFDFGMAGVSEIQPIEGLLTLFPPYLKHGVTKNLSDDLRISISGDFKFRN